MKCVIVKLLVALFVLSLLALTSAGQDCPSGQCATCPTQCDQPPAWRPSPPNPPSPSTLALPANPVVIVRTPLADGGSDNGTGTLIAADEQAGLIITAAHNIRGARGLVEVHFSNGTRYPASILARHPVLDLALLRTSGKPPTKPLLLGRVPAPGELLTQYGWGGSYHSERGNVLDKRYEDGAVIAVALPRVISGDSGSPLLDARSALSAVLFGKDRSDSTAGPGYAVHVGAIIPWVEQVLGRPILPAGEACLRRPLLPIRPRAPAPPANISEALDLQGSMRSMQVTINVQATLLADMQARIEALESAEPRTLAGPPGPAGKDGRDGIDGKDADWEEIRQALEAMVADFNSNVAAVQALAENAHRLAEQANTKPIPDPISTDYDRLAAEVAGRLPPIRVQTQKPDGTVVESQDVYLGGVLPLRLVPVSPTAKE